MNQTKNCKLNFHKRISCLESLSNELLCEIFGYLEGCALFEAFGNLNSRFQNMIQSPFLQLKLCLDWKLEDQQLTNIVFPNRHNVISLKLSTYSSSLIECSLLRLDSSFHLLQSLIINKIECDYNDIIPCLTNLISLPQLSSISLDFWNKPQEIGSVYQIIFNMSALKYAKVSLFSGCPWNSRFTLPLSLNNVGRFSQIKYLNIDYAIHFNELINIFLYIPELHRLMCNSLLDSDEYVTTNFSHPIKTLTHITFHDCEVEFDTLANFFSKVSPNIEVIRLNITLYTDPFNYLDPDKWEKLITNNLRQLRVFEFTYHQRNYDDLGEFIFPNSIDRFNSIFWTKHNWIFQVYIDFNGYPHGGIYLTFSVAPSKQSQIAEWNNSAANQLIINNVFSDYSNIHYLIKIEPITTTINIFTLDIICEKIFIGILIELILYLPKLTSLIISSLELIHPRYLTVDKVDMFQIISESNTITHVKIKHVFDLSEIHFLLQLCPKIEYFEMNFEDKNLVIKIVRFILMKNIKYIPNLSTLCFQTDQTDIIMKDLKRIIDLEQLCQNYTMERIDNKIYLKYTR